MILLKLHEALALVGVERKELLAKSKALDETEAQLQSMISKLSAVSGGVPLATIGKVVTTRPERERDKLDDIADALRMEGKPLHITVIAERLSAVYGKKVMRTEIEPGVNRHIAKAQKRRIEKFGPSTFGLPEWKTQPTLAEIA